MTAALLAGPSVMAALCLILLAMSGLERLISTPEALATKVAPIPPNPTRGPVVAQIIDPSEKGACHVHRLRHDRTDHRHRDRGQHASAALTAARGLRPRINI